MAGMRKMQLALLILSLQLAQIASAGDKARHSENNGLGRRQAGQVVRRSRSRGRLLGRGFDQDDRREEGDVVTPGIIESRRSIRKGMRKAAEKILNGLDKAETIKISKESEQSEQVRERRILKRKKERQSVKADVGSEKGSNKTVQAINMRFGTRQLYQRKPVLSQAKQEMPIETIPMTDKTTTTVNPVLIWRQQAALAEQEPRIQVTGRRAGMGRGRGRRIKININKSEYSKDTLEQTEDLHHKVSSPKRRKTIQQQEETTKGSFKSNKAISSESKYQRVAKRRPGRMGSSQRQNKNTESSREYFDRKDEGKDSGEPGRFPFRRRLSKLKHTLSASQKVKPVLTQNIANGGDRKTDTRPIIHNNKSIKMSLRTPSYSSSSVASSVTSTAYSVTDIKTDDNEERKDDDITGEDISKHTRQLQSRRRSQLALRNNYKQNLATRNTTSSIKTTGTKLDPRLRTDSDARIRSRGRALKKDSYKASDENIKNRVNNVLMEKPVPRPKETKLNVTEVIDGNTTHFQLSTPPEIYGTSIAIKQRARGISLFGEKDASVSDKLKGEKDGKKEILRTMHEPVLNENLSENHHTELENARNNHLSQENAEVLKVSAKPNRNSVSQQNHHPLLNNTNVARSESSSARVVQRLKLRFDPRRRNGPTLPHKMFENQDRTKDATPEPSATNLKTSNNKNNIKRIQLVKRQKSKLSEGNKKSLKENPDKLPNNIKIKASNEAENKRPAAVGRKKTQSEENIFSESRRRGGIPPRQGDNPESTIMTEQSNRKYKPGGHRTVAHRRRQKFDPRKTQQPDEDSKDLGSDILSKSTGKTTVPISVDAAPEKYLDIARAHAEVTWAQDPFRAGSAGVEGPQFDIDYTKDPNYNTEDNEGPVGTFSNFGTEEESFGTETVEFKNKNHENTNSDRFTFVPSIPRIGEGTITEDRSSLHNFAAVTSQPSGSFSDPDPVFVPFFVPDLSKQGQDAEQHFFQPFSFSVDL